MANVPSNSCALPHQPILVRALLLFILLSFSANALIFYGGAGHDDTFIFLWAGHSLSFSPWFANTNGELEDMLSSPLTGWLAWICVQLFPDHSFLAFKLAGLVAGIGAVFTTYRLIERLLGDSASYAKYWGLAGALLLAVVPSFLYWTMGGMETIFLAFAYVYLSLSTLTYLERRSTISLLTLTAALLLATLLRIETLWVPLLAFAALRYATDFNPEKRRIVLAAAVPLIAYATILLARYHYTGYLWPNPVYAKGGDTTRQLELGLNYLLGFYASSPAIAILNLTIPASLIYVLAIRKNLSQPALSTLVTMILLCGIHDALVVLAGGNWMTHFRFLVPTLPLKIALILWLCARYATQKSSYSVGASAFLIGLIALTPEQNGVNPNYSHTSTEPKPISLENINPGTAGSDFQSAMIDATPPHSRDNRDLKPFIDHLAVKYSSSPIKSICVATYQAGYFPWLLRQRFSPAEIYLVDTIGLNNRSMALRAGSRNSIGLEDGMRIDRLIHNRNGALIEACHGKLPDLVYTLGTSNEEAENYRVSGYFLAWRRPEAVVYMKEELFHLWKAEALLSTSAL